MNQSFFALCSLLQNSARPKSKAHATAMAVVRYELIPILDSAFKTYPELDPEEILALCEPAMVEVLEHIINPNSRK
jgi:hypothetical protein